MVEYSAMAGEELRQAGCEIPNLDCFTDSVTSVFAAEMIFARLAAYCGHKKDAMRMREAGDIEAALASERCADNQYQQLPGWVRW